MYEIETYDEVLDQLSALPREALLGYAEVLGVLKLAPWSGEPYNPDKPDSAMRQFIFGRDGLGMSSTWSWRTTAGSTSCA